MKYQNDSNDLVKLKSVTKIFDNSNCSYGIKEVSINIIPNEIMLLLGPSGSGKTTLLKLMSGLIEPSEGSIVLFNKNINEYSKKEMQTIRAKNIGFVFQTFNLIDQLSVLENVIMVLRFAKNNSGQYKRIAMRLLGDFNIEHLAKKMPNKLSQGEKQRVAIVRALANLPDLIIADEPTACLDTENGKAAIELLYNYAKKEKKSLVIASHDLRIKDYADRIINLRDGKLESTVFVN